MADRRVVLHRGFEVAAPGANTDIITDLTISNFSLTGGKMVVQVAVDTSTVFNVIMDQGATSNTLGLNQSVPLTAGDLYEFEFEVDTKDVVNFQVETNSALPKLFVVLYPAG